MHGAAPTRTQSDRLLRLLVGINALGLSIAAVSAALQLGVGSAYACTALCATVYLLGMRGEARARRAHMLAFGLVAGTVALAADWWLVSVHQTLRYGAGGPRFVESPLYMPLSWAGVTLSIGFFGWLFGRRRGRWAAVFAAGLMLPLYEVLASLAGWWSYTDGQFLDLLPWHLVTAEFLLGLPLPLLVGRVLTRLESPTTLACGLLAGLWIVVVYVTSAALIPT